MRSGLRTGRCRLIGRLSHVGLDNSVDVFFFGYRWIRGLHVIIWHCSVCFAGRVLLGLIDCLDILPVPVYGLHFCTP